MFFNFSQFNVTVISYWKNLSPFLIMELLFVFYPIRGAYMLSTTIHLIFRKNWSKRYVINLSALSLTMISLLSLLECITCSLSLSLEEIKLIAIVNWFFRVSEFLRSFMISFKYRLILLRYSSSDSFLFISPLFSYSI